MTSWTIFSEEYTIIREEVLVHEGWEKQMTYDEPRLSELVELFEGTGFETLLEPFNPEEESGCVECMRIEPERYKTIYTRKRME